MGVIDATRKPSIPRTGGWSVLFGLIVALLLVGVVFVPTGSTLLGSSSTLAPVTFGAIAIWSLGVVDDRRPLSAWVKFGVQLAVALTVYYFGLRVTLVSLPTGPAGLGVFLSPVITVIWLLGITNAFNLLDGADGVATGSAFFSATAIFIVSVVLGHPAIGLVTAALAGALLGFLPFNLPPARLFLGDSGSLTAGFLLAALAIEGSTKASTLVAIGVPLLAFAVPVFDTALTIVRRLARGKRVFDRDQDHIHHRLSKLGLSPMAVAGVLYAASAAFGVVSMLFINPAARSLGVALVVLGAGFWLTVRYLRLHELNELARLAKRGLLQPRAIAINVQLRQAAERLAAAETMDDIGASLALLFTRSEFDDVLLLVSPNEERRGHSRCYRLSDGHFVESTPDRTTDEWEVVCPFQGTGWTGELRLRRRLGRHSLLLDLNLLLEVVQPSLNRAAKVIADPNLSTA